MALGRGTVPSNLSGVCLQQERTARCSKSAPSSRATAAANSPQSPCLYDVVWRRSMRFDDA